MKKRLTDAQIEEMAFEIRRFLIDNRLWIDTCIYFNGKAFATFGSFDEGHEVADNDPERLIVLENVDAYKHLRIEDDILSMSFEGALAFFLDHHFSTKADILDCCDRKNVTALDAAKLFVWDGLMRIFQKRGLIFEMQTRYKLTARDPEAVEAEKIRKIKEGEDVWISENQAQAQNLDVGWHILSKYRAI